MSKEMDLAQHTSSQIGFRGKGPKRRKPRRFSTNRRRLDKNKQNLTEMSYANAAEKKEKGRRLLVMGGVPITPIEKDFKANQ